MMVKAFFAEAMTGWRSRAKHYMGPNVYTAPPDGGWGWVVAVSFFLVEVFTYGFIKSFGIFLHDLMQEFGESNSRVSWIISICVFVMTFTAPLASLLTSRFGFRPVVMVGGLLISIGSIASGFTSSINQMYITMGLIGGQGFSLTFLPTVTILSQYFSRRRYLVTTIASTGECFFVLALAPAFSNIKDYIGWRYTMVVIGALQGVLVICGFLLRPIIIRPGPATLTDTQSSGSQDEGLIHRCSLSSGEFENIKVHPLQHPFLEDGSRGAEETPLKGTGEKETKEGIEMIEPCSKCLDSEERDIEKDEEQMQTESAQRHNPLNFSMLREGSFICYSLFGLFATLGFFAPQLYVIELSISCGVERNSATYMLSAMAVAEIFGRFCMGWVLERKLFRDKKLLVLLGFTVLTGLVLVAFTMVWEFWGLAVCCGCYGFLLGTMASSHVPMLAEEDVVGIERMVSAAGVYVFIQSFAGLAGPPLGGVLVDLTNNYGSAFYSCAVGMGLGAVFLGLVRPAKKGLPCCRRRGPRNDPERLQVGPGEIVPQCKRKEAQDPGT
ncbi:monocarboxylate transporter 7 isoform X2 [Esox lucius]|uniref:monocarboxylate transporter 7 isoform X2 n=1 Tax=Esox lucius TaxID=8010 RepID=UPI000973414D|nr:monocarboxylate transporter 7 isoform X2 [Esox lucius]